MFIIDKLLKQAKEIMVSRKAERNDSVLTLEAYIAKRKKEYGVNETNIDARNENMQKCINFVIEYFNSYLDTFPADSQMALQQQKIEKYRHTLENYDPDVQNWCVQIYADYGKQITRRITNAISDDTYFFLRYTPEDFSALSYDVYSKLIRKLSFLQGQNVMLLRCIQEYHHQANIPMTWESFPPSIDELVNDWINDTYNKYGVNLIHFAEDWTNYFWDAEESWPRSYRIKSDCGYHRYEYDYKQSTNLFNLDSLYRKMPKTPFTRGKKQQFEIILMYTWLNSVVGDKDYWDLYIEKIHNTLSK